MSDSGLARPYKSPGHVSLDPLICPGRRPFRRPVPPKNRPPLLVFDTRSSLAPTLRSALLNQTILECADWGQITVSYTVLPLRRSFAPGLTCARSRWLATAKKRRQIKPLRLVRGSVCGCRSAVIAPPARGFGQAPQQSKFPWRRITCGLPVHGRPNGGRAAFRRAPHGAVSLLGVQRKILQG